MIVHPDGYIEWLAANRSNGHFAHYLDCLRDQCKNCVSNAMQQGDTDFLKGQAKGLEYAIELPDNELNAVERQHAID